MLIFSGLGEPGGGRGGTSTPTTRYFSKVFLKTTLKEFLKSIFETFENISLMFDQLPRESPPSSTLLLWQQKGICSATLRWGIGSDIFRQSFFLFFCCCWLPISEKTDIEQQSSIKCSHATTVWWAEQGSCEPISELRARSRERDWLTKLLEKVRKSGRHFWAIWG